MLSCDQQERRYMIGRNLVKWLALAEWHGRSVAPVNELTLISGGISSRQLGSSQSDRYDIKSLDCHFHDFSEIYDSTA